MGGAGATGPLPLPAVPPCPCPCLLPLLPCCHQLLPSAPARADPRAAVGQAAHPDCAPGDGEPGHPGCAPTTCSTLNWWASLLIIVDHGAQPIVNYLALQQSPPHRKRLSPTKTALGAAYWLLVSVPFLSTTTFPAECCYIHPKEHSIVWPFPSFYAAGSPWLFLFSSTMSVVYFALPVAIAALNRRDALWILFGALSLFWQGQVQLEIGSRWCYVIAWSASVMVLEPYVFSWLAEPSQRRWYGEEITDAFRAKAKAR